MKRLTHIISGIVWTLAGLYLLLIILLHIPAVQGYMGRQTGKVLSNKLGTEVRVGKVNLGILNRLIIDDVVINDQQGDTMIHASRLSAKVRLLSIPQGKISISSAQLFGLQGHFYQKDALTPANYQFMLDSLASKDTTQHQPLDISIGSLIVRHGSIDYDRYDIPVTHGRFNTNHLHVNDISAHILLPTLTDDNLEATVKKISFKEASGLDIQNLSFRLKADKQQAYLKDFSLRLPNSHVLVDSIGATYQLEDKRLKEGSLQYAFQIPRSTITPSDIACFEPMLQSFTNPMQLTVSGSGTHSLLQVNHLLLHGDHDDIDLKVSGSMSHINSIPRWYTKVDNLRLSGHTIDVLSKNLQGKNMDIPAEIVRLGDVDFQGEAHGTGTDEVALNGSLLSDAGNAKLQLALQHQQVHATIVTNDFNLRRVLDDERFGNISANLDVDGTLRKGNDQRIALKGNIQKFQYNNYVYNDLSIDGDYQKNTFNGQLTLTDPNGDIDVSGMILLNGQQSKTNLTGTVRHFNPQALHLSNQFKDASFDADIDADFTGNSLSNMNGTLDISHFSMTSSEESYALNDLHLLAANDGDLRYLNMQSDFGNVNIQGQYDYASLPQSIINFIGSKLPTLPGLPKTNNVRHNNFTINADITRSDWLNTFLHIPVTLNQPMHVEGTMNDQAQKMDMTMRLPAFTYDGGSYEDGIVSLHTSDVNELLVSSHLRKLMDNGQRLDINLNANAANNELITSLNWNNNQPHPIKGTFNSTTEFFKTDQGKAAAHMRIHPSEVLVNDTVWHVQPSDIIYSEKNLLVDYFAIEHNKQHIIITGKGTESAADSLVADLQDVDVNYILNLVNFHSVEFSGKASGKACVKAVFHHPQAYANLSVGEFRFQEGRMGTLYAAVNWNEEDKQIDIDAHADETDQAQTLVKGFVSPARHEIDLAIGARNTRLEFLESFCGSFMDNVEARGTGDLRLAGDLSEINLTGMIVGNGGFDITTLNTHYVMQNDTVRLIPDEIIFRADTIRDRNGNIGILSGALHHKHLTRLTFDLDIQAQHLLCYDFPTYGDNTFYGTVIASGNCAITGRSGRIDFDISGTPERNSFIEYNAASPDAISKQEFITWRDKNESEKVQEVTGIPVERPDIPSDIHINFLINTTPDFTLRVLMDQTSGDYIALNGNGSIHATYFNKGAFDMFGNYNVDHGVYKLTIQNIIKKDFQFQQGSTIVFGGDPYDAVLNLKALYTVSGVPLSDLQIGKSFSSNNIRVDCIMNITGTPQEPHVEFDLDLPTVNTDAKQMVRALINGEEEMNQQVIYLLSIGRFYTQNTNNAGENNTQSQTSLAMQSLLSGTISQQINSVLSSFVNTSNWNFGANISTGDEGWNNAEYEGLLSGRLLNNRLLINGQFGYRDNANATTSFIGDFDVRYLLFPSGNLAIKVYNQTNDRYFTRNSLTTQGVGLIMKKDFNNWRDLFGIKK